MNLAEKIKSKKAQIGIIGLGYVGLPLVIEFCKAGFNVTGFDIDANKVTLLKKGESYIKHIDRSRIAPLVHPSPKGPVTVFSYFRFCASCEHGLYTRLCTHAVE